MEKSTSVEKKMIAASLYREGLSLKAVANTIDFISDEELRRSLVQLNVEIKPRGSQIKYEVGNRYGNKLLIGREGNIFLVRCDCGNVYKISNFRSKGCIKCRVKSTAKNKRVVYRAGRKYYEASIQIAEVRIFKTFSNKRDRDCCYTWLKTLRGNSKSGMLEIKQKLKQGEKLWI